MADSNSNPSVLQLKTRFQTLLETIDSIEPETTNVEEIDELLSLIDEIEQQVDKIKTQK